MANIQEINTVVSMVNTSVESGLSVGNIIEKICDLIDDVAHNKKQLDYFFKKISPKKAETDVCVVIESYCVGLKVNKSEFNKFRRKLLTEIYRRNESHDQHDRLSGMTFERVISYGSINDFMKSFQESNNVDPYQ